MQGFFFPPVSHNLSQQKQLKTNYVDRSKGSKVMFLKHAFHSQSFRQLKHQYVQN